MAKRKQPNEIPNNSTRVMTGIPGFDDLVDGGLLRNDTYLLAGTSGVGKTVFSLQYLYNGVTKYKENGIFIATEERPQKIREKMKSFGWDLKALEDEGKLAIVDACSTKIGTPSDEKHIEIRPFDMGSILNQVISIQRDINAKRVVVDSSTSIGFSLVDPQKIRIELLKLCGTLEIQGLTSILTCETMDENTPSRFGIENFITDGIIMMHSIRDSAKNSIRFLEIIKMRGSNHGRNIYSFEFNRDGIHVSHEGVYLG